MLPLRSAGVLLLMLFGVAQPAGAADAQMSAAAARAGIWAAGACGSSGVDPATVSKLGAFVDGSSQALQQATLALTILHEQALSAPRLASSPTWQATTNTAIVWLRQAGEQLRAQGMNDAPLATEVWQLGTDVQAL